MNDNAEEKDLSRDLEMNIGNGKAIECTVKSLDLSRLLESHERTSGNDYLYEFCHAHPIPEVKNATGNLTPEEACLADQMWLIGRSYAASPERYAYSKTKPKEKEEYLGSEGYESFFQDIARMFLRNECHDGENPIAYFRDEPYIFDGRVEELRKKYSDEIQKLRESAKRACEKLRGFQPLQDELKSLKECRYKVITLQNLPDDAANAFKEDWETAKKASNLIIRFAEQLNAARALRDIVIICLSLESPGKKRTDNKFQNDIRAWAEAVTEKTPSVSISFCSKFLHFHYPQLFFIYDSISSKRAKAGNLYGDAFGFELKASDGADVKKYSRAIRSWIRTDLKSDTERKGKNTELDGSYKNRLIDCQEHAFNELVIAYAIYRYLDKGKEGAREQQKAKNKLREHLKACTNDQDDSHEKPCIPPRYLSITRLVDELVTNSSPENMEETKETD